MEITMHHILYNKIQRNKSKHKTYVIAGEARPCGQPVAWEVKDQDKIKII